MIRVIEVSQVKWEWEGWREQGGAFGGLAHMCTIHSGERTWYALGANMPHILWEAGHWKNADDGIGRNRSERVDRYVKK